MTTPIMAAGLTKSLALSGCERSPILRGADLSVAEGESVAVLGRSGSGKSTLLSLLGLLDTPDDGTYHLAGVDTSGLSDCGRARMRGEVLGFVFQRFFLSPHLSALENVNLASLHGRGRPDSRRAREVLQQMDLGDRMRHRPRQLSGGEQQRVAIARALVNRPRVVLADEPTGALDIATADVVLEAMLAAVSQSGAALVLVTHDLEVAAKYDRRLEIVGGRLAEPRPGGPTA